MYRTFACIESFQETFHVCGHFLTQHVLLITVFTNTKFTSSDLEIIFDLCNYFQRYFFFLLSVRASNDCFLSEVKKKKNKIFSSAAARKRSAQPAAAAAPRQQLRCSECGAQCHWCFLLGAPCEYVGQIGGYAGEREDNRSPQRFGSSDGFGPNE